jgi:hypothetical protein
MSKQRRTTLRRDVYHVSMPVCHCAMPVPEGAVAELSIVQDSGELDAVAMKYTACRACHYAIAQRALMLANDSRLSTNERLKRASPKNPVV